MCATHVMLDRWFRHIPLILCLWLGLGSFAMAQALTPQSFPGPADAGRIKQEDKFLIPDRSQDDKAGVPSLPSKVDAPEAAKSTYFVLKSVTIKGATAFTPSQLKKSYAPYIGNRITLADAYEIANKITERYRSAGYFLSLAHVPNQRITNGIVIIQVVEGYISKVDLPPKHKNSSVIQGYVDRLLDQRPVTSNAVESFLLRLNDLPGYSFRAVLAPVENGAPGETKLVLEPSKKAGRGSISIDNYSSRFLGPHEATAAYSTSLLPMQQTSVSGLTSLPTDTLNYGTLNHRMVIAPDVVLELNGGLTKAYPGYRLESSEIKSTAASAGLALNYQWVRQRDENFSLKLGVDSRDVATDTLGTALTRDHIRALRLNASYDTSDQWSGYNAANLIISQGIDGLGANKKSDANLSRAGAIPDFTKAELSLSRLQRVNDDWSLQASAMGQIAAGGLYSSEQFGYGGQAFGRAYDSSEITGDQGISGSLELRYSGWSDAEAIRLQPYVFYDVGQVWNDGIGQSKSDSADSAGIGVRFATDWQQTGNIGVAMPLHRDVSAPLYGSGSSGPRILFQVGQEF